MALLKDYPYNDGVATPEVLLNDVIYHFQQFNEAKTQGEQATHFIALSNLISDLKSWMPSYDEEYGTLDWEREDEEYAADV